MSWRRSLPFLTLALTLPAVIALGAPAPAAAQQRGPYFELFGSYLRRQSFDEQALGGRAGYRFSEHWAMEANLSRLDLPDSLWFEDVSAKYYFWDTGRTQLFALGGGRFLPQPG